MQPCPELIELVLQNYEHEASGEILEVLQTSYSRQEGMTVGSLQTPSAASSVEPPA
jgi:hypothetical protein